MDRVDQATRSRIMSSVRQQNTGPELILRSAIHKGGMRYRLHEKTLPGSPDLVFKRFGAVIFIHGCYWHFHGCHKSAIPNSRREYWEAKFRDNQDRDDRNIVRLQKLGWRVLVVWECAMVGKTALVTNDIVKLIGTWLRGTQQAGWISGGSIRIHSDYAIRGQMCTDV